MNKLIVLVVGCLGFCMQSFANQVPVTVKCPHGMAVLNELKNDSGKFVTRGGKSPVLRYKYCYTFANSANDCDGALLV